MKILLIYPKDDCKSVVDEEAGYFKMRRGIWYPLLTFPVLAAYTPEEVDEIKIIDEEFEAVNYDERADLVGITVMTYLSRRAYEVGDNFRRRGVKVVMGGMHVSALPEEALQHADAVVVGEGEEMWPQVVRDAMKGELKRIYKASALFSMDKYLPPRLDLLAQYSKTEPGSNQKAYTSIAIFEVSRGCPYDCDFCAVTNFYGKQYRFRKVEELIADVRKYKIQFKTRLIGFVDDNLYGNKAYFKNFLRQVERLNVFWSGQISVNIAEEPDLVKMMADSGCRGMFLGIESISQKSLESVNKRINTMDRFHRVMELFRKNNIMVFPSIMFGLDGDTPDIFEKTNQFLKSYDDIIGYVSFALINPLPGTRFYDRMLAEGRIIQHDWRYYNFNNVVLQPKSMSVEELQQGYEWIIRQYDYGKIFSSTLDMMGNKSAPSDGVF